LNHLPHLAQRFFNVPVAIAPPKAEVIIAGLAARLGIAHMIRASGERIAIQPMAFDEDDNVVYAWPSRRGLGDDQDYDLLPGGIAQIPVHGTLVQKNGTLPPYCSMTADAGIRQAFWFATNDPEVRPIVLDIDSPGGEVAGCLDLVDAICAARGTKPIWSIPNEAALQGRLCTGECRQPHHRIQHRRHWIDQCRLLPRRLVACPPPGRHRRHLPPIWRT